GLLDARFLAALPRGAALVNLGRGAHVVDADLLAALDRGHLRHAVLDVFHREPLPAGHPYWTHPQVTVLPHAAAATDARSAAAVVAANLRAARDGAPIAHLVDRRRAY
ncbi:MAG TPA: NAD(P)-dependent oxidoreductase, partial [Rubrivivax sp.]|nr:NAD(P)-dependent oxidoreductase [Rubrivivax sp.]